MFKFSRLIITGAFVTFASVGSALQSSSAENDGVVRVASAVPIEEAGKRVKQAIAEKGIQFLARSTRQRLPQKLASNFARPFCSSSGIRL
jgi:hypothetical protein